MTRVALIATISVAALLCAAPADAQSAANAGLWWGKRTGFGPSAFARKTEKAETAKSETGRSDRPKSDGPKSAKDRADKDDPPARSKKNSKDRPSEAKAGRDSDKPPPEGPLHIIVSIDKQRATLFANGEPFATTKISSGTASHPTPMGVFSVIQKRRHHISNLYDAPMPFMQRITWTGSALHQGPLPGYPASHGCVRLTTEFAELLWKATKIGTRVIITSAEVRPEAIEHARLDALLGLGSQAGRAPDPTPVSTVKLADAAAAAYASAKKRAPAPRAADEAPAVSAAPARPPIMPVVSAPIDNASEQQASKVSAVDGPYEAPMALPAPLAAAPNAPAVVAPAPAATPAPTAAPISPAPAPEQASKISTAIERLRGEAKEQATQTVSNSGVVKPAEAVKPAEPVVAAPVPAKPAPAAIESKQAEPKAPAPIIVEERPAKPAAAAAVPAIETPKVAVPLPPAAPPREASRKPVSLFISLKDRKLYARQGMEPMFEMPIGIADSERPLGTHVFTAMRTKDGGGLRWTVVSIPSKERPGATAAADDEKPRKKKGDRDAKKIQQPAADPLPSAAAALDRIVIPASAMERIAGLVLPGSSLIVSDNKLSDEANNATEFIVMTR